MSATEPTTRQFSRSDEVCITVAMAVADETETPVDELPPLYTAIDPDALDAIVQPRSDSRTAAGPRVSFPFAGCTVDVGDGTVVVTADAETTAEPSASTCAHAN